MTAVDIRLASAVDELRSDVDRFDPPPFTPRRSSAPAMLALALIVGLGIVAYVARTRADDAGDMSVITQPEEPAEVVLGPPVLGPDGQAATEAQLLSSTRSVTEAAPGEFFVPLMPAWSNDGIRILVYRTGSAQPGHLVVDTRSFGLDPIELPFTPADIEQIYWHPLNSDLLLYTVDTYLMMFDLTTGESTRLHQFLGCDRVDSGVLPVPPALDGTMSLLCHTGAETTQIVYGLSDGSELRAPTTSDSAAFPSPSGKRLVRWNDDGTASVLNRDLTETGVVLALDDNVFGFVTDPNGREWVAATLFDGPAIGSVVVLPVDGVDPPVVLIGPDRGDAYPPPGTLISANGDKIAISIRGLDDGTLAGRVTLLDLTSSFTDPERRSIAHGSSGVHDYWSNPFVSVSPSGLLAHSRDDGGAVNTFVTMTE